MTKAKYLKKHFALAVAQLASPTPQIYGSNN
jgi:hypothetical protein